MSKIIDAYLKRMKQIHENDPHRTDPLWATKILYEARDTADRGSIDMERDIIYHAERIEPDRAKWDISVEDYEEALSELHKRYPRMN